MRTLIRARQMLCRRLATIGLAAVPLSASVAATPMLSATPAIATFDEPIAVRVSGAQPGSQVVVRASLTDDNGDRWSADGHYFADVNGTVDTARDVSIAGSYTGGGAAQLLCAVLPTAAADLPDHIARLATAERALISPTFAQAHPVQIEIDATVGMMPLAPVRVTRTYAAEGVTATPVETAEVSGVFYAPAQGRRSRPVLVVGGSGGGIAWQQAALLASRGHSALALGYFAYKDLPPALVEIPLERFAAGGRWLRERTGASHIAVMGTSRGSEAVQLLAVHFPQGIDRVVAIVPSHLVNAGLAMDLSTSKAAWTLAGEPVPFVRGSAGNQAALMQAYAEQSRRAPGYVGTPYYLETWNSAAAAEHYAIPVERIRARVLALAGTADAMWPSWIGAERIRQRMAAHGLARQVEVALFPGAGHGISAPPFANAMSSFLVHPVTKTFVSVGGAPSFNCQAKLDGWRRILDFIR